MQFIKNKKMEKIKSIEIKIKASGQGIINFDSNDQKFLFGKVGRNQFIDSRYKNVSFSKKVFTGDPNDRENFDYKIRISEGCVKAGMFKDDVHSFSPSIAYNSDLLMNYITSEALVSRGYLFADENESIKKKGVLTLTGLTQDNDAKSHIEIKSRNGEKVKKTDPNDSSDTSLFYAETIGDVTYANEHVIIDLTELQFICGDSITDRMAVSPEDQKKYLEFMRRRYGKDVPDFEYYRHATSAYQMPEIGILLPNDVVVHLAKFLLKRLLGFQINKSRAYVKMDEVKIKFVSDALDNLSSTEEDWITLTPAVINNLDFEVYQQYIRDADQLSGKEIRDAIAEKGKELKEQKLKDKAAAKLKKEEDKNNK